MKVVDAKTGQELDLPEDQALAGYTAGQYGLQPGQQIAVKKGGSVGYVPAEDFNSAVEEGYLPASQAETTHAEKTAKYDSLGHTAGALGAGVARGLTLGLSDYPLGALAGKDTLQDYKDYSEIASTGGEIAGAVLPLLLSGGGSAAATGAKAASAGRGAFGVGNGLRTAIETAGFLPRMVARGGEAIEGATSVALRGLGEGAAARAARGIVPQVARGSFEGAAQGLQNAISEDALGDTHISADKFLSHVGTGALFGGVASGGLGTLLHGGSELSRAFAGTGKRTALEAFDSAAEALAGASAKANGYDVGAVKNLIRDHKFRETALRNPEGVLDDYARKLAAVGDEADDAARKTHELFWGEGKAAQINQQVAPELMGKARTNALDVLSQSEALAYKMRNSPALYSQQGRVEKFQEILNFVGQKVEQAETAGDVFNWMNYAKQRLGKLAAPGKQLGIDDAVANKFRDLYDNVFKAHLEDEALYAKAAITQRETNAIAHPSFGIASDFKGAFHGNVLHEIDPYNEWMKITKTDPARIKAALQKLDTVEGEQTQKALMRYADSQTQLFSTYRKSYKIDAEMAKSVDHTIAKTAEMDRLVKEAADHVRAVRTLQEVSKPSTGGLALETAGALLGGSGGFALGAAAKQGIELFSNTGKLIRTYDALRNGIEKFDGMMSGSVAGMLSTAATRARRAFVPAISRVESAERTRKEFLKKKDAVLLASASPEKLRATISSHFGEVAPKMTASMQGKAIQQAEYLRNQLSSIAPGLPTLQPGVAAKNPLSPGEMAKFSRIYDAVTTPAKVLGKIKDGSVTKEEVDALRATHPEVFSELQSKILTHIQSMDTKGRPMPYKARQAVNALFGITADQSQTPEFVASIQAAFATTKQQQPTSSGPVIAKPSRVASVSDALEKGLG